MKKLLLLPLLLLCFVGHAQKKGAPAKAATLTYDDKLYNALEWRSIGPFRGGRSAAVTGVPGKPNLFYFGATGGGVWRTTDAGNSWENISDGFLVDRLGR
jgi:hypothetical protein